MPVIHVLSPHVADLIAAGEVVERPASAVKELLENAVDAGARTVVLELRAGGRDYIRVTDDGVGMAPEDAGVCFLRHATSKLSDERGLEAIGTLGFRGEALAAISAVSRITLTTRRRGAAMGVRVEVEAGEIVSMEETGCPEGTTIVVRDLFYNTPARMKFLKKDFTEAGYVLGVVQHAALSHPEIAFTLIRDGKQVFSTDGKGKLITPVFAVFGKEMTANMVEVPENEHNGLTVHGYIVKPHAGRANRSMQHFFVNGRYVKSRLMQAALASEGYQTEVLGNCGSEVAQLGLKYVHNDTCYPALLVIGQFLDALNSGKYDLDHTALLITQTGGGCRASNYIKLLRKALVKAGYGNIPVASLNFSGLEKGSGLPLTVPLLRKVIASIFYGDMLVALRSQTHAYENHRGDADAMTEKWISTIQGWIRDDKNYSAHDMKRRFYDIAADYATIPITRVPKVKVGVVGEIYVKYSPLGNNDLEKFLESQDCEVNLPGLMGFVEYCVANYKLDIDLYGGNKLVAGGADAFLSWLDGIGCASYDAMRKYGFYAPGSFRELMKKPEGIISLGAKMGEGWLLTAEMIELVQGGYGNIVCAQPFGCLPNHIVGKGMVNKIRAMYPSANITPIDYDPSATKVNQENRIKLMLAVAKERLNAPAEAKPLTAEEIAGGAPSLSHV